MSTASATAPTSMSPASWSTSRKPASIRAIQRLLAAGSHALARHGRPAGDARPWRSPSLNVGGLMNVQYAIKDDEIYVLEVNPRASRTVPFVAKTVGSPIAKVAARVMAGENLADAFGAYGAVPDHRKLNHIAVKEAVFPFAKFPGVDTLLGPEMRSTGEVMGLDRDYAWPSPRPSSAPATSCRARAPCSSRSATRTSRASSRRSHPHRQWLQADGHRRHRRLSRRAGLRRRARQQGDGRPSAHRGRDPQPPGPDGAQHHRRRQDASRIPSRCAAPR
jgi:hypothetical protein